MIMIDEAIYKLYPNAVQCSGGQTAYDKDGNELSIDWTAVNAELSRLQAEYDAKDYQRKRATEYPDFRDYLDGIVKGDEAQVQAYIDACNAVKAKYPKG